MTTADGAGQRAGCLLHFSIMGRILCIDFGRRRTGVAVSDITKTIAQGLPTIEHKDEQHLLKALQQVIRELDIECLPGDIPEAIEIDVTGLGIGDSVQVSSITTDKYTIMAEPERTLATVSALRQAEEAPVVSEETTAEPEIITRGFIYAPEAEDLLNATRRIVMESVNCSSNGRLRTDLEESVRAFLFSKTKRRPMVFVTISQV